MLITRFRRWFVVIMAVVLAGLLLTFAAMYQKHQEDHQQPEPSQPEEKINLWGVDSASRVSDSFYQCVADNFGKPDVWGRYLETKGDASFGLTKEEISFIHEKDVKILPIYNNFSDATGNKNGVSQAKKAISFAKDLDIPKGIALFADIEPTYPVDSNFIEGWTKTLNSSKYKPGIYGEFSEKSDSNLRNAYQSAVENINQKPILWSSLPRPGITTKDKAPDFNPDGPQSSKAFIWQYGLSADKCSIDTDLVHSKGSDYLW